MRSSLFSGHALRSVRRSAMLQRASQSVPVQRPIWRAVLFLVLLAKEGRSASACEEGWHEVRLACDSSCLLFLFVSLWPRLFCSFRIKDIFLLFLFYQCYSWYLIMLGEIINYVGFSRNMLHCAVSIFRKGHERGFYVRNVLINPNKAILCISV